jgi:hypothetical protein
VDISKWREDIQEPAASNLDFMFKSNFSASNGFEALELKDTVSEHSMDSAYQSQTGRSQRGSTRPDGNQWMPAYDFSAMHNQFPGSNLTSPTLAPGNATPFSNQANFHQARHAEGLDAWTTDAAEQVMFSPYSSTSVNQNALSVHPYGMFSAWDTPTTTPIAPFASYDTHRDVASSMFDMHTLSQPHGVSVIGAPAIPAVHSSPSFAPVDDLRRASAQSATLSAYGASPPNSAHTRLHLDVDFHQQQTEAR